MTNKGYFHQSPLWNYFVESLGENAVIRHLRHSFPATPGEGRSPSPPNVSMTTILPCLPDHLRRQVLAEQARLLEMARSIENNQGERPREVALSR